MSKLINLRHFDLGFNYNINVNPGGFGRLTSLRTLKPFIVNGKDDSERCNLGELINLNHLKTLAIDGLGNEVDECEAMNAQLKKKINLHTLKLGFTEWGEERDGEEIIREKDALILNALEPPPNLEYLRIVRYKAPIMFPNWMMSLTNLKELEIGYSSLECLPPLGKLPFLKSLNMWAMKRLKKLGVEFMGIEESEKKEKGDIIIPLFPNLISLYFEGLYDWEEWNGIEEEEDYIRRFTIMPRLQHLNIRRCPKLNSLPNYLRTTPLQKLQINDCPILREHCKRGTGKEWPKISHIPHIWIDRIYVRRDGREREAEPKVTSDDSSFPKFDISLFMESL
nr:putative disease resistance protein RGA3 [Quercus suber]XP_023920580.1 putative disease resistance protein RGA3 [Quercus suber]XP_023920581.1 putative disease resistance protein RGA3 [Quercus suber]XP_023920582.1 putative disease resistance protein RGA3 [Quercus suber]XP_023920583.1 putative disease resistance protein RGA3 [Quercus suber]XP_023920584.1 putative disease resistance protein RGA3 [Quercus suber]XP_023920586.1 putative disease resistance protein RGA3 [Quercus suber]XP_02392058